MPLLPLLPLLPPLLPLLSPDSSRSKLLLSNSADHASYEGGGS
jgi:hypothetical protein